MKVTTVKGVEVETESIGNTMVRRLLVERLSRSDTCQSKYDDDHSDKHSDRSHRPTYSDHSDKHKDHTDYHDSYGCMQP